jgi:hypothetical protein
MTAALRNPRASTPLSDEQVRSALDSLRRWTSPQEGTTTTAQAALRLADRVRDAAMAREQRVEAMYYEAQAHLLLEQPREACRVLARVAPLARGTRFENAIDALRNAAELACPRG